LRIRIGNGLWLVNLLTFALAAVILFFPLDILRIILGLPFLLFFPGYALLAALLPGKGRMDGMQWIVLSFGISLAVVPLIGLILNYTPWGIRLEPILYSFVVFILVASIAGWLRRRRLTEQERFNIEFQLKVPSWGGGVWDKVLSVILVMTILGALGTLGYIIATPKVSEKFTEFYILGLQGKASDYPREIRIGEEAEVIVGIINHEHKVVSYRVEVKIDGVKKNEVGVVELAHEQKWEEIVSFTPDNDGDNQEVEFLLYKNGETEPTSSPLHLRIDVTE